MLDPGRAVGTTTDNHGGYREIIRIFFKVNYDRLRLQPCSGL